jgi:hypothetical protein
VHLSDGSKVGRGNETSWGEISCTCTVALSDSLSHKAGFLLLFSP